MNIREQVATDIGSLLRQLLHRFEQNIPTRMFYEGKVVDNDDPDTLGRCRIRVFGIFDDKIADKDLPWAMPEFAFVGSKVGSFTVPPVDAVVKVRFENGDFYTPIYSLKGFDKNNLPSQKDENYPNNVVLWETDDGDFMTLNRETKEIRLHHKSGAEVYINTDGEVVVHAAKSVRLDSSISVILGDSGGYVVTAPAPGSFVTQSGHILTAQEKVRA